jgi:ribonuclease HII
MTVRAGMPPKLNPDQIPKTPNLSLEIELWKTGIANIAGIDESGRGALAGPVIAAVVILPPDPSLEESLGGVRDSKQMTPHQRSIWSECIRSFAFSWSVGMASQFEIDRSGILPATRLAAERALENILIQIDHVLLDYLFLPDIPYPQTSLIKGDARSLSIASASVLAKTTRDALMCELDSRYPGYYFSAHKGYGTRAHLEALRNIGPSPAHRLSFQPITQIHSKVSSSH